MKPQLFNNAVCTVCGCAETVALKAGEPGQESTITWCANGHVYTYSWTQGGQLVWDFSATRNPVFGSLLAQLVWYMGEADEHEDPEVLDSTNLLERAKDFVLYLEAKVQLSNKA